MKSVGEVMAIDGPSKKRLQKGIRSLEPSTPWRAPSETPDSLLREKNWRRRGRPDPLAA